MSESNDYKKRNDLGMGVFEKKDGTIWKRAGVDGNYTYYGGNTEEELLELENRRQQYNKYYGKNSQGKGLSQMTDKEKKAYYEENKSDYYKGEPKWYNKGPLAKRNMSPSTPTGEYFEPDSAHFSHIQRIVKDKNDNLKLNADIEHSLTDFNRVWLNNHYDPQVYDEIQKYVNQGRYWKTNTGARTIQKFLKEGGYYDGEVDGMYGPKTKKAAKEYLAKYHRENVKYTIQSNFQKAKDAATDLYERYIKSPVDDMFGE